MNRSSLRERFASTGNSSELVFVVFALAGFVLNCSLLIRHLGRSGLAGCGGGSCDELFASRWSVVFGVPVVALGVLVYLGLLISWSTSGSRFRAPLLGAVLGAAFWFLFVQAVLVGYFCGWCLILHGVGLATVALDLPRFGKNLAIWGYAAFLALGLIQVYGPQPTMHRIVESSADQLVRGDGTGRKVSFYGGKKSYLVESLPRIGSLDAKHVIVEYFDYQCPSCRTMGGYLAALVEKYPADVCVVLLSAPLDPSCNDLLLPGDLVYPDSCEFTRIALAVWRKKPEAFASVHGAILADSEMKIPQAMSLAARQLTHNALRQAMEDPWIDEFIAGNLADWAALSGKNQQLPKLLIRENRILHGLPSGEADFIRVMKEELGL